MNTKCLNLALMFCLVFGALLTANPARAEGEPPEFPLVGLWNEPAAPSINDFITFGLYGYAPSTWVCMWNFGDGTIDNNCFVDHAKRYGADGDYLVSVQVTNELGEASSTSRVVPVRTHDVAITRFIVPQSARSNQTRQLVVNVSNSRYPERVQVEVYKLTPDGDVWAGTSIQLVPVRPANRTTPFSFNYTFTAEDARAGKVTFRAIAFLLDDVREAWPADNEIISLPTRVSR
jgi:hypothetical protein